jgi:DNA anti-recombination protein RmuC
MWMKTPLLRILLPVAFASLVLAGCENQPGGTGEGIRKNAREAVEQAGDYLEKKREEFLRETDEKLKAMEAELEEMRERMEEAGDEARSGVRERIEELERKRDRAARRLEGMRDSTGEAWEDMKEGVDDSVDEFEEAVEDAKSEY